MADIDADAGQFSPLMNLVWMGMIGLAAVVTVFDLVRSKNIPKGARTPAFGADAGHGHSHGGGGGGGGG
eukprot:m.60259 g.60259  ORF g.60259 m.60259 type:complete len:69 (-) comp22819_c1_seq1:494-700(-)